MKVEEGLNHEGQRMTHRRFGVESRKHTWLKMSFTYWRWLISSPPPPSSSSSASLLLSSIRITPLWQAASGLQADGGGGGSQASRSTITPGWCGGGAAGAAGWGISSVDLHFIQTPLIRQEPSESHIQMCTKCGSRSNKSNVSFSLIKTVLGNITPLFKM